MAGDPSPGTFRGFPREAIQFYEGLALDNSKAFWQANKPRYDTFVRAPMVALLHATLLGMLAGVALSFILPRMVFDDGMTVGGALRALFLITPIFDGLRWIRAFPSRFKPRTKTNPFLADGTSPPRSLPPSRKPRS